MTEKRTASTNQWAVHEPMFKKTKKNSEEERE